SSDLAPHRLCTVRLVHERLTAFCDQPFFPVFPHDVLHGLLINSRASSVRFDSTPRDPHDVLAVDLVVQRMKASLGVCLGRKVEGNLELSNFCFGVVSRRSCIHSLLPPPCPVNEVRVLSSAGLCCPRLLGTMTPSESLPAACHFTLRAYRFAVYDFCRAGEGFPSSRH